MWSLLKCRFWVECRTALILSLLVYVHILLTVKNLPSNKRAAGALAAGHSHATTEREATFIPLTPCYGQPSRSTTYKCTSPLNFLTYNFDSRVVRVLNIRNLWFCSRGAVGRSTVGVPRENGPRGHSVGVHFHLITFYILHKRKMKTNHLTMTIVKVTV